MKNTMLSFDKYVETKDKYDVVCLEITNIEVAFAEIKAIKAEMSKKLRKLRPKRNRLQVKL